MLYARAMGDAFEELPEQLRAFHNVEDSNLYAGEVTVTHGHALSRGIAKAGGMPAASGTMPFRFRATRDGETEIWERRFGNHMTRSLQWLDEPGIVAERIGTSTFHMAPVPRNGTLYIPVVAMRGFGLPVPRPAIASCEGVEGVRDDGAVTFDVHARLHGLGLVIRYQGWMAPA